MNTSNTKRILAGMLLATISSSILLAPPKNKKHRKEKAPAPVAASLTAEQTQSLATSEAEARQALLHAEFEALKTLDIRYKQAAKYEKHLATQRESQAIPKPEAQAARSTAMVPVLETPTAQSRPTQESASTHNQESLETLSTDLVRVKSDLASQQMIFDMAKAEQMGDETVYKIAQQIEDLNAEKAKIEAQVAALTKKLPNTQAASSRPTPKPAQKRNREEDLNGLITQLESVNQELAEKYELQAHNEAQIPDLDILEGIKASLEHQIAELTEHVHTIDSDNDSE